MFDIVLGDKIILFKNTNNRTFLVWVLLACCVFFYISIYLLAQLYLNYILRANHIVLLQFKKHIK